MNTQLSCARFLKIASVSALCASLLASVGCSTPKPATLDTRSARVTLRGQEVLLHGVPARMEKPMGAWRAIAPDLSERNLSDYRDTTLVLCTLPSLLTPVCNAEAHEFNRRAADLGDRVRIVVVSIDPPQVNAEWCAAADVKNIEVLSDAKYRDVGRVTGVVMAGSGKLARAVFVVDNRGMIRYAEVVSEVSQEPDYDAALRVVAEIQADEM